MLHLECIHVYMYLTISYIGFWFYVTTHCNLYNQPIMHKRLIIRGSNAMTLIPSHQLFHLEVFRGERRVNVSGAYVVNGDACEPELVHGSLATGCVTWCI